MPRRITLLTVVLLGGACARRDAPPAGANIVSIEATDFAFAIPDTLPAGLTTLRMVNNGQEQHHMVVVHIADGKTLADFQAAMTESKTPDWITFPGSPGAVAPGDTSTTTATLEAGQYVAICFIPSPDGKVHAAKGMVRPFTVAGATPVTAAEPEADVTATLSDYAFAFSKPLTAGAHVIRVENAGPQVHEITFERLGEGKGLQDFVAWGRGGMQGPPPSTPVGGLIGPTKGRHAYLSVTLPPGQYLVLCYVPDEKDGKPHIMHGMMQEITIS